MTGKTLDFRSVITPDNLGTQIARKWHEWFILHQNKVTEWEEVRKYLYATDTTKTSNARLPWRNTTTIPKLCNISDNLFANYMATLFPRKKWLEWEADDEDSDEKEKRDSILNYMRWVTSQPMFKEELTKLVLDYIHYGNVFAMPEWVDFRKDNPDQPNNPKAGYVGPVLRRISPLDIVFNPTAPSFIETPKIIRSLISMGELKKKLMSMSPDQDQEEIDALYKYFKDYRATIRSSTGSELITRDEWYRVDGFTSWRAYLESDYCEILTFYGDLYDYNEDILLENHQIMVVDRHKVVGKKPNPSYFGYPPIFNCGWRPRQDNLWAMGPLDNLVGMQYRIDHLENMKADVFDLIAFPTLKVKGYVEDFEYRPMERIVLGDDGEVEMLAPPFQVLQTNIEIEKLEAKMEMMAGSPKEAVGFRTPGEKTAYEFQHLENAASRVFQQKIAQFEEQAVERWLNAMLELARRQINGPQTINVFDDDFKFQTFLTLTADDITGAGRIKPVAARHFAERADIVQSLTNFAQSAIGQDQMVLMHISSIRLAQLFEQLLDIGDYKLVIPFVRISEQQEAQKLSHAGQEQTMMEAKQPAGLTPDDHNRPDLANKISAAVQQPQGPIQ
jgi:hypothetical protein